MHEEPAHEVPKIPSTSSLTQNDLPSTARRARIGKRKGYKDAQNTPEGSQKWTKTDVPE
jgi:hypothetical protein